MPHNATMQRHERLVCQMADKLGVDLDEAELKGDLPPDARSDMVLNCTGCSDPNTCEDWLSQPTTAGEAPAFCRNRDQFADLPKS